jgi:hypothetical protein
MGIAWEAVVADGVDLVGAEAGLDRRPAAADLAAVVVAIAVVRGCEADGPTAAAVRE